MASRTFDITVNHVQWDDDRAWTEGPAGFGKGLWLVGSSAAIGVASGKARIFMKFDTNWSDMHHITSATLHIKEGEGIGQPTNIQLKSIGDGWSAGGMTWATMPSTANQTDETETHSTEGWRTYDVTDIIKRYAPVSVGGDGDDNNGVMLRMDDETTSDALAYYSISDGGNEPYITVVYVANDSPEAPTINEPDAEEVVNDTTPDFQFTHNDPNSDPISAIQVQIREYPSASDWSDLVWDSGKDAETDETPTITSGVTLTRGQGYYVRARTWDDFDARGVYSSGRRFFIASLPTASITEPDSGDAAPMYYTLGSDVDPKFQPTWSFSCADGGTQASASIKIYADSAGSPGSLLHTHAHTGSALVANISGYTPTNGTKYHISVTPTCSHGAVGAESTKVICRARWGRAAYRADLGSAPVTLSVATASTLNSGQVLVEYSSSAATTPEPTDWKADIAEVTKQRYIWHRVTLLPQSVAAPTSPQLLSVVFTYSANALTPDNWTLASIASVDVGTYVYGTQSLKHAGDSTSKVSTQVLQVVPNTDYILSGRVKTQGTATATIELYDAVADVVVASSAATDDTDWTRYATDVWSSGENSTITVRVRTQGGGTAWFDALKMEASLVVTPWQPGYVGQAVTLDAGGIGIDGLSGGVFRLRGSTAGTYDTVKLGTRGLIFGDTQMYGSASGDITITGDLFADNVPRMLAYDIDATDNSFTSVETICSCDNVVVAANRLIRITGNIAINPSAAGQTTLRLTQEGVQVGFWKEQFASGNSADNKGATIVAIVSSGAGGTFDYLFTAEGSVSMSADGSTIAPSTLLVEDIGPA